MSETQTTAPTPGLLEINPWQPEDGHTLVCGGEGQSYGLVAEFLTKVDAVEAVRRWNAHDELVKALKECRGALQYFIDSEVIERTSVVNAWAAAVAAESKARAALGEGK